MNCNYLFFTTHRLQSLHNLSHNVKQSGSIPPLLSVYRYLQGTSDERRVQDDPLLPDKDGRETSISVTWR